MALANNAVYTIRNELTHTVLDFTGNADRNLFAMGWGWHGGNNQRWKLIQVDAATNKWKLQNQRSNRFLCPRLEDEQTNEHYRLVGGIVECDFVIRRVGQTQGYRIFFHDLAVTLVTGQELYNIQERDRVLDLHADGPPVALQPVDGNPSPANIWSFHLADNFAVNQPLPNGAYKIVNYTTGTVLDITFDMDGEPVHGLVSRGGANHMWIITSVAQDRYTFRRSTDVDHFLVPDVAESDQPENGTPLMGKPGAQTARFTIRNVPNTQLYMIFLAANAKVSGLAVNLAVVDGAPDSLDGAVVTLQAAEAQTWYFVPMPV